MSPRQILRALLDEYAMSERHFRRLHHARRSARIGVYAGWLEMIDDLPPIDVTTMRRLSVCLRNLRAGRSWDDAIGAALREAPL